MKAPLSLAALALVAACGHARDPSPAAPAPVAPAAPATHRRGVVVNHWLASSYDEVHSYGGAWFDREDVAWIARHGFDHVRLRVSAKDWLRADGTLDPDKLAPLDAALSWTAAERLGLTIAVTAFPVGDFTKPIELGDEGVAAAAARVWGLLARRYAAAGDELRFELLHGANAQTSGGLIAFNRRALAAIREVSARRFVYVTVTKMAMAAVGEAELPSDPRTGLAVTFLEPEAFTFQIDDTKPRIAFPGEGPHMTPAAIDADFAKLAEWVAHHAARREIYIAQLGVHYTADEASQRAYLAAVRAALDRHRLAWAVYDYESGCRMRGTDGTPTAAYEALGLGPAARELRFAYVEGGKATSRVTLRVDGRDRGMRYAPDAGSGRTSALVLDQDGMPARYDSRSFTGADDWKAPALDESFRRTAAGAGTFYVPQHDDPLTIGVLARWLVEHPGARLPLEPRGEATAELAGTLEIDGRRVTQIAILGLDLEPVTVWLDDERELFAMLDGRAGYIALRHAASVDTLAAAQDAALARRAESLAARLVHRPERGLLIRRARVFDPVTLGAVAGRSILIIGDRIAAIGADGAIAAPPGVEEIDAAGRFVMPGLWDSHAHLYGRALALMHLAGGVTTVREMGNEGELLAQMRRYDGGVEAGPRAVTAMRFGAPWLPLNAPRVTTEAEARALVESSTERGYAQLKVLDNIDPKLVPVIAQLAHGRGLRFSGHLPSKMTVAEFIAAGADEIQHVLYLFAGQRGVRKLDDEVRGRIALMARRRVTLDPTLAQFEVAAGTSGLTPVQLALLPRLPPLAARGVQRGAIRAADQERRRAAFAEYGRAVRAAVDANVTVVPGTDALLPGFMLHRELELYVELGLAPARVLRMATLDAARNMKRDARSGSIARGKDADLLLIDGDPMQNIADLRRIHLVVKGGATLSPQAVLEALSIRSAAG